MSSLIQVPNVALSAQTRMLHATARLEGVVFFALGLCANITLAWLLVYVWHIGNRDALARTANAFYVGFSRYPHLAAVGFVWPPLPSLLQLPLIALLRPLGMTTFAGPVVSCVFGALSLVVLNSILMCFKTPRVMRWILLALMQFNPGFWYLAASGLAEIVLLFFLLIAIWGYLLMPGRALPYALTGMALALAFFVRYEALAVIAGIAMAMIVQHKAHWGKQASALVGQLVTLLTPPLYAIGLWLYWNWQIMGDPLFFQRSQYSLSAAQDIARNVGPGHSLYSAWGNPFVTCLYAAHRLAQENVAFPVALVIVLVVVVVRRDRRLLGLLLVLVSVPAFTALQVYGGTLASWMRYWFYATPFTIILIAALINRLQGSVRSLVVAPLVMLAIFAAPFCLWQMRDTTAGLDEQRFSTRQLDPTEEVTLRRNDDYWKDISDAPIIARVLDRYSSDGDIVIDSVLSYAAIMATHHPERLVITNDQDFKQVLDTVPKSAHYIMILEPTANASTNVIAQRYPELFAGGMQNTQLEHDFTETYRHWRLYRMLLPIADDRILNQHLET